MIGDKIYLFGGWSGALESRTMQYDPATDEWTQKTDMPTPRTCLHKGAPVINGKVYIIGGYNWDAVSVMEIYDPETDTWTKGVDMPTARFGHAVIAFDGRIYSFGGCIGADIVNQTWCPVVEEYDTGFTTGKSVEPKSKLATLWGRAKVGKYKIHSPSVISVPPW